MNSPKTLLQLAGAHAVPARLSEAAVVIVDAQNEYVNGALPLTGVDAALDRIARLLKMARDSGTPVFHVVHRGRPGGLFDPAGKSIQIHPKAAAVDGEQIIEKELPNAFAKTALHPALLETKRMSLVIAGFATHLCISSTARAALDHGWRTTVVGDATATRDLPDMFGGEPIPAVVVHRVALAELADRFATIARVADLQR